MSRKIGSKTSVVKINSDRADRTSEIPSKNSCKAKEIVNEVIKDVIKEVVKKEEEEVENKQYSSLDDLKERTFKSSKDTNKKGKR